jgi:hypothetical protein
MQGDPEAAQLARMAEAAGFPYAAGSAAASPGGASGYLITKVGPFLRDYQLLAQKHADSGSEEAALITCERTQSCFQAWGSAYAFHSRLLTGFGRHEEARDLAKQALSLPLWTLGGSYEELVQLCGISGTSLSKLTETLQDKAAGKLSPEELRTQNGMETRSSQQIAKDRASYLLDLVVAAPEQYSWESIRQELSSLYREAEMTSIASFVKMGDSASP